MTWARLDDAMGDHPKIVGLSDRAFRAHVLGILYCAKHLTDGHVPDAFAKQVATKAAIEQLTTAGVWDKNGSGYVIHDYADYNPTRSEVEADREKRHSRALKGARARWGAKSNASSMLARTDASHAPVPVPLSLPNRSGKTPRPEKPGGDQDQAKSILPRRLLQILDDKIAAALTRQQAEVVAAAWQANDVELRQSMAKVEAAANPAAYLVSMCQRLTGARA